jgi:hypothetical protein
MNKERKTASELEAIILAELNDTTVRINVIPDPMGWHATAMILEPLNVDVVMKVQEVAERLRTLYDLKEK